jgi:hypothetical protein
VPDRSHGPGAQRGNPESDRGAESMDGSFACPECGAQVEVQGLAPGRQVRCGFCERLLEVPFLPRAAHARWKRRRFGRPKWVPWAWAALGIFMISILVAGAVGLFGRVRHSVEQGSIHRLVRSSVRHEGAGELSEALNDLDTALELARTAHPPDVELLNRERSRRRDLARRDAEAVLGGLRVRDSDSFPLGEWLDLLARCERDGDLASSLPAMKREFAAHLRKRLETDLSAAERVFAAGEAATALDACERVAKLLTWLPDAEQSVCSARTENLATRLISRYGVTIDSPQGRFILGSQKSYLDGMLPVVVTALEQKGYLPYRKASPWRELWRHAPYQMRLELSEQFEGNYLASENRLTRIEAHLTLSARGKVAWQTRPTALSTVPLPNLSAFAASRLASSAVRSEEIEQILHRDAREQINGKVGFAVRNMPAVSSLKAP